MAQGDKGTCSVCDHPDRIEIEKRSGNGDSWESIASFAKLTHPTISKHYKNCPVSPEIRMAVREARAKEEVGLARRTEFLQKRSAQEVERHKTEDKLDHDAAMEQLLREVVFLRNWAEEMSEEVRDPNNDVDYVTKMKMLDNFRKVIVTAADIYLGFQRLNNEEKVIEQSADMKAIREQILGRLKPGNEGIIDV